MLFGTSLANLLKNIKITKNKLQHSDIMGGCQQNTNGHTYKQSKREAEGTEVSAAPGMTN